MTDRRYRVQFKLDAQLVDRASQLAQDRGDVLTDYVHAAVISATKAAEAGQGHLLPRRQSRQVRATGGTPAVIRYTASREQAARCAAALEAAGSSMRIVVVRALQAYIAADGSWLDADVPGESRRRRRGRAGTSVSGAVDVAAGAA